MEGGHASSPANLARGARARRHLSCTGHLGVPGCDRPAFNRGGVSPRRLPPLAQFRPHGQHAHPPCRGRGGGRAQGRCCARLASGALASSHRPIAHGRGREGARRPPRWAAGPARAPAPADTGRKLPALAAVQPPLPQPAPRATLPPWHCRGRPAPRRKPDSRASRQGVDALAPARPGRPATGEPLSYGVAARPGLTPDVRPRRCARHRPGGGAPPPPPAGHCAAPAKWPVGRRPTDRRSPQDPLRRALPAPRPDPPNR